ncbi:PREDICTED: rho GTPase-activating protein gacF-like isoform X2 [Nicrophorus vespilloides]|uniref:Rho GTPase-activating protein gacF-like isoform X2 n=1 Tax=Nicrophorus vespilloides TaxID=110193 RepID=A0ABM1MVY1_NICVS|nr:PREDICTED: rho GTPase-activating protein gacF-like isoform X2 [Nicrophorus vespilloides]
MGDLIEFNSPAPKDETSFTTLFNSNDFNLHLNFDLGRESMPFRPSSIGRESLQVLDITGRESLGILHMNSPSIRLTEPDFLQHLPLSGDTLNTAILHPLSFLDRKNSNVSSVSSNAFSLYNSSNFNESVAPSTIYSANSLKGLSSSDFNNAFISNQFSQDDLLLSELNQRIDERMRLYSLPVAANVPETETDLDAIKRRCISAEVKSNRTSSVEEDDDEFNDSVFIEAHHIACKIADGSILEASYEEGNILDCTPQPFLANDESDMEIEKVVKCDKESMFKEIDRIIPPQIPEVNEEEEVLVVEEQQQDKNEEVVDEEESRNSSNVATLLEYKQNLLDLLNGEGKIDVSNISNRSRSVCSSISSEDSGHSSIEDKQHNRPISDVEQEKEELERDAELPLDLSRTAASVSLTEKLLQGDGVDKGSRLCQSFGMPLISNNLNSQVTEMKNIIIGMETKCNVSSDSNASSITSSNKLKPKKIEETKKGPMKAMLPVNAITKKKDLLKDSKIAKSQLTNTPLRKQSIGTSISKRISTPLINTKLKPMAQSTPDRTQPQSKLSIPLACSSQIKKKSLECSVSPLVKTTSFDEMCNYNMNKSDSVTNVSTTATNTSGRCRSTNEGSKGAGTTTTTGLIRPRRYSVGKENLVSSLRKIAKPNLSVSDPKRTEDGDISSSRIALRNTSNRSIGMKPTNLMSKIKCVKK